MLQYSSAGTETKSRTRTAIKQAVTDSADYCGIVAADFRCSKRLLCSDDQADRTRASTAAAAAAAAEASADLSQRRERPRNNESPVPREGCPSPFSVKLSRAPIDWGAESSEDEGSSYSEEGGSSSGEEDHLIGGLTLSAIERHRLTSTLVRLLLMPETGIVLIH